MATEAAQGENVHVKRDFTLHRHDSAVEYKDGFKKKNSGLGQGPGGLAEDVANLDAYQLESHPVTDGYSTD